MKLHTTDIDGIVIVEPQVFKDDRGYFFESFSLRDFSEQYKALFPEQELYDFVQDNESKSSYGVVRGLHFQKPPYAQSKLVRVVKGRVLDIAVDLRTDSKTYGKHFSIELNQQNHLQLFIPRGFAHGFAVLEDDTIFQYKCDNYYNPQSEGAVAWDDADLNIHWPVPPQDIILSEKDKHNVSFSQLEKIF